MEATFASTGAAMETEEYRIFLLICGDTNVGKTTLVQRLMLSDQDSDMSSHVRTAATIGVDYQHMALELPQQRAEVQLFLTDVPGNTNYAPWLPSIYRNCHGAVFMYDVHRRASFESMATRWAKERDQHAPHLTGDGLILIANKTDLPNSEHVVTKAEGLALAETIGASGFYECSATEWSKRHLLSPIESMVIRLVLRERLRRTAKKTGMVRLRATATQPQTSVAETGGDTSNKVTCC